MRPIYTDHSIYVQISNYRHKSLTLRANSGYWQKFPGSISILHRLIQWPVWPFSARSSIHHISSLSPLLQTCSSQLCKLRFSFIFLPGPPQILNQDASLAFPWISHHCSPLPVLSFQLSPLTNIQIWHRFDLCIMVNNTGSDASCRDMCKCRISVFQMGTTVCFTCRSQCPDTVLSTLLCPKSNEWVKMNNE